jgi:transcriptional regulator with AAA-type ATPase domain
VILAGSLLGQLTEESRMQEAIGGLVAQLQGTKHFEDAALVALRPLLRTIEEAIEGSPLKGRARALRAVLHVRPDGAYDRLFVLSSEAASTPGAKVSGIGAGETGDLVASASAWRVVLEHRAAACIDVERGWADLFTLDGLQRLPGTVWGRNQKGSQQRLLGRDATHMCVLPLFAPGGSVEGMICTEVEWLSGIGQPFIWQSCIEALRLMVQIAAPYVTTLPPRRTAPPKVDDLLPVIGASMEAVLPTLRVFAQYDETLIITGPTGAGKSRFARWCHTHSNRKNKPFEVLDLTTVPENLQMANLFGWKKGAFTGADRDVPGYLENAKGGTLFIDEIDKLSLGAQAGLLQLLDGRRYHVIGEKEEHQADVRFIIGTNADLPAAVAKGLFRSDLYYRINVLPIRMLPLSRRVDEIPQWAQYMIRTCHRDRGLPGSAAVAPGAETRLSACSWPGNLRQLDNIVRRSYMIALGELGGNARDVTVLERHVAQALAYEAQPDSGQLKEAMSVAAAVFVRLAEGRPEGIDLGLSEAFAGFVLGTAIQMLGYEKAWQMLKCQNVLKHRNDSGRLRKEMARVVALLQEVHELPSPFAAVHARADSDV